ncbi:MAG: ArsB/NhaD family transporter [Gallionellaceae bacterium]|nr:ArsB/NhaD family transporter [Gallionellaceae bacterium]
MTWLQIVSIGIFFATFVAIFMERVHRTIVAIAASAIMLLFGMFNGFYSQEEAFRSIDFNTILLLLWMMLTVVILEKTGYLQYLAIHMAQKSKGRQWPLLVFLGTTTTVLSTMLDNVTTVVVIAPVTIAICKTLKINPIPYLIAEAVLSDTGGVGTLIGDPPNVIIGSAAGLTFNDFLIHLAPITAVVWIIVLYMVKVFYRTELSLPSADVQELMRMNPNEALTDWPQARKVLIVLGGVMTLFLFHGALHLQASTVAFIGFATALTWARPDPDEIMHKIDWSVLLFFSALFVLVGGVERSGALEVIGESLVDLARSNILAAAITMLWAAALISAIVDNIPFTIAMVPIIKHLESQGIPTESLWWALAMGAGFGGNGTPIGSTANVVIVSISEKTPYPISFKAWIRKGIPITIVCCTVASLLMAIFFPWYSS